MLSSSTVRAFLVIAGLGVPAFAQAEDLKGQVHAAAEKWDKTYNGDTAGLSKLYTANATVIPAGGSPVTGTDAIQKFFTDVKAKGYDAHKITVQNVEPKGNVVIAYGRWEMVGPGDGGAKKTLQGNWINVMERQGDELRTVLHTWN